MVGFGMPARLKTLVNSARTFRFARSLIRKVRPNAMLSEGRRW